MQDIMKQLAAAAQTAFEQTAEAFPDVAPICDGIEQYTLTLLALILCLFHPVHAYLPTSSAVNCNEQYFTAKRGCQTAVF